MKSASNQLLLGVSAIVAGALLIGSPGSQGAEAAAAAPKTSSFDDAVKASKNPAPWFSWGMDIRPRNEYFNYILNLGEYDLSGGTRPHEQDYFRIRGRLWTSVTPVTNLNLYTRLAAEPRVWMKPASFTYHQKRSGTDWRYGILDNVNVKYDFSALDVPLTIKAGRQDVLLGDFYDWWLVADGTPRDGSWTFFLDSVRLTYQAKDINTTLEAIYIHQNAKNNEWIPVLNNLDEYLTEQNEKGVILYGSNKSVKNTQIDAYFMYKGDSQETTLAKDGAEGVNADIFTMGGKVTGTVGNHWSYSAEGAYQFGNKQDASVAATDKTIKRDIQAYGGKAKLTYSFKDRLKNQAFMSYEFLSGDDPDTTDKDEMFDVLWGRWPRWSELYIYSYALETSGKIAQLNNIQRFGPGWSISPMRGMNFSAMYNALFAHEQTPTRRLDLNPTVADVQNNRFSYNGNFRGHYLQTVLKHQFNKYLSGHLWGELVWMGDYYSAANRELMSFLRAELLFTY